MSIFKDFFNVLTKNKAVAGENKFSKLSEEKKQDVIDKTAALKGDALDRVIEKQPYLLPFIIGDISGDVHFEKLVDIATKANVGIYDLVDKTEKISNAQIVNIAVKNQPQLVFELDDMPSLQDLITQETFIDAFIKNPEILFSDCKVLKSRITISGTSKKGKKFTRTTTLKAQLQRAMNLYFRPETEKDYDTFAKSIADRLGGKTFETIVESNKMTTRSVTAANETLKKNPAKGKMMPAKALKNWNNRVLYTVPNVAKKSIGSVSSEEKNKRNEIYKKYSAYIVGLLKNSSLKSFTEKERTKLAKRCVSICPEVYFELLKIEGFKKPAEELTVQLSAYEAFKAKNDVAGKLRLLSVVDAKREQQIRSRSQANETRKANKAKKVAEGSKELKL